MSMILIYHFMRFSSTSFESSPIVKIVVFSLLYWGVNVFVMISGYFGIKARLKSFVKLYSVIAIFILAGYGLMVCAGQPISIPQLFIRLIFPFSKGEYWFMGAYFGLFITAPLISAGLSHLSMPALRTFMVVFTLFTVVSCGLMQNLCNTNGYNYMQFVFLYCIGSYLRREQGLGNINARRWIVAAIATAVVEIVIGGVISVALKHESGYFTRYNNMFVLAESICIFMAFTRMKFNSKHVNFVASASLGCYLLQDGIFGRKVGYEFLRNIDGATTSLWFVAAFIAIWVASLLITTLNKLTIQKALTNMSDAVALPKPLKHLFSDIDNNG